MGGERNFFQSTRSACKFYACNVHILSKMLLHNREDLINFDQVLEFSSPHGAQSALFLRVTDFFTDFCKPLHLTIKRLIA